jgi:hypothetical protein
MLNQGVTVLSRGPFVVGVHIGVYRLFLFPGFPLDLTQFFLGDKVISFEYCHRFMPGEGHYLEIIVPGEAQII